MPKILSRRAFIGAIPAGALALAGCTASSTSGTSTATPATPAAPAAPAAPVATAASDVSLIASGLAAILPQLGTVNGIASATVAAVGSIIADLQKVAAAVASAASAGAAQPLVSQVESDVNAVVDALDGVSLPSPIGPALEAASVLLPVVEAAVGLVSGVAAARRMGAAAMIPEQARLILAGLAKQ